MTPLNLGHVQTAQQGSMQSFALMMPTGWLAVCSRYSSLAGSNHSLATSVRAWSISTTNIQASHTASR